MAVADGHWGNEASELAVEYSLRFINTKNRAPKGKEPRGRLYALYERINRDLYDMAMNEIGAPTPETTLIVSYIEKTDKEILLYWASFGDSYLFLFREGKLCQLNTIKKITWA